MNKAAPIEHEGYEVPNWVLRCKETVINRPVIIVSALILLASAAFSIWDHNQVSYSPDTSRTIQPSYSSLKVLPSDTLLPATAQSPVPTPDTSSINPSNVPDSAPIGPAPTSSRQYLQPTAAANSSSPTERGLTGAITGTSQAAGVANDTITRNLGL